MNLPTITVRNSLVAALTVAMLPLVTGCGGSSDKADPASGSTASGGTTKATDGSGQLTIPDGTDEATKKSYIEENALASCMKKQGFTYTPHVAASSKNSPTGTDGEDYAVSKKFRQKHGFGTYAAAAYPNDPAVNSTNKKGGGKTLIPEDGDEQGFTPGEKKAYDTALHGPPAKTKAGEKIGGCDAKAQTAAYGKPLSAAAEKQQQAAREETNRSNGLALNGDTQLVRLAQQYATCLRGQGIPVTTTQPTSMSTMVVRDLGKQLPERHHWTKEEALPLLTKDIAIS